MHIFKSRATTRRIKTRDNIYSKTLETHQSVSKTSSPQKGKKRGKIKKTQMEAKD